MMIGIASSGKTTISKRLFPKHIRISLDEIPKYSRTIEHQIIEKHLQNGDNIIIDDTNLTRDIRSKHIEQARKHGATINAVFLDLSMEKIQLQNSKREKKLPDAALFKMQKQLERPMKEEGFGFIQTLDSRFSVEWFSNNS